MNETLRAALEAAIARTHTEIRHANQTIDRLTLVTGSRKPNDKYVDQAQLFRVIDTWKSQRAEWQAQLKELIALVDRNN